ncbi:MAG: DUF3830 family protein [Candidatus Poribacteria bacterium]|nr:DUF3830 family protein [Candidatus Poribacteria bacterium]
MARYIEVTLKKRGVSCVAQLLDDLAPKTCEAVWRALPLGSDAYHAKYASNEVYTLVPPFAENEPGLENPTILPIPGDLLYFYFPPGIITRPDVREVANRVGMVDLAIFYDRDNFLFSPATGPVPGSRYATVTENLEEMAKACDNIWREGFVGEELIYRRLE